MSGFELQIVGLILMAFAIGIVIGYFLRVRTITRQPASGETRGITLESRQERKPHSLLRSGKGRSPARPERKPKPAAAPKVSNAKPAAQTPAPARESEPENGPPPQTTAPDNLQDIRGIGAVLEKKLNAMGVTRFDQIAAWTESDIAKVDETLNFRGRIQRERWVEQARELTEKARTGH